MQKPEAAGVAVEPAHRLPTTSREVIVVIRPVRCPICEATLPPGAATESDWFPFCSERCRNVDLYRWGSGRYAIIEPLTMEGVEGLPDPHEDDQP